MTDRPNRYHCWTSTADIGSNGLSTGDITASTPTVLVVDNYDSFAYNLVQYVGELVGADPVPAGADREETRPTSDVVVSRNDDITLAAVDTLDPDAIVVSPGPGRPAGAGISVPLFAERKYPTFGVCLGHQALCVANGASISHAEDVVHGKSSPVSHDGDGIFAGLPASLDVGRYHSLGIDREDLPDQLTVTAWTTDGRATAGHSSPGDSTRSPSIDPGGDVVMGVRHRHRPQVGVQFHPESILTDEGITILKNFLREYSSIEVEDSA